MSTFYIYVIQNIITGKIYVGKTNKPNKRWSVHQSKARTKRYNLPLYNGMNKYGFVNFTFDCVENDIVDETEAFNAEIWWISYFKYLGAELYNLTNGGEGMSGRLHTEETKNKISQSNRGKQNRLGHQNTLEHNKNISNSLAGKEYSILRKKKWYLSYYKKSLPDGLYPIEKPRNKRSESHKGEKNGKVTKLNDEQVRQIKQLLLAGLSTRKIAKLFGVGKSIIGDIGRGRCWSHINI